MSDSYILLQYFMLVKQLEELLPNTGHAVTGYPCYHLLLVFLECGWKRNGAGRGILPNPAL
jgi:hypothetical protein